MKRKGFTLIELLAVIVVLAIIALIATPIVMNTIKNAKKGAAERTADNYIKQVETTIAEKKLENNPLADGPYTIDSNGNLTGNGLTESVTIDMSGTKPNGGTVTIANGLVSKEGTTMTVGDYNVVYSEGMCTASKVETYKITYNLTNVSGNNSASITNVEVKSLTFTANTGYQLPESVTVTGATSIWDKKTGTLIISKVTGNVTVTITGEELKVTKTYKNGEAVYFNVDNGTKCTSSEAVSTTGTKSGCMKFYAFNDNGGDTVNLLLDHNTTALVAWNRKYKNDSGSIINAKGPKELLDKLKSDTSSWKGTITPSNYTMDQTGETSNAKYTIDYSGYKARLITAKEIAKITGNTSWNEKVAANSSWYYFDTNTTTASDTCKKENTSGCSYGWLYDRTSTSCTYRGCLNNSDQETYGYWTASSCAFYSDRAWFVYFDSSVGSGGVKFSNVYGVRPVITVLRSKLS